MYLDCRHKDHFEVFNKRGKVKDVLNPDGTSNSKKFNLASGRKLK
ncbi:filamentous hemagglutinin family outer membrane protein [Streptococcus mitis 13/39]|uniref:Filamentous hemagglutinin family outer membrane protein n=1 Tax=Streptococcus mitis 13/39 TaxID=1239793 RepID=R0NN54_STRMT|nr:filamentous hemagglutinin family outer membrane protein [Streptococcus mitis 13/39]